MPLGVTQSSLEAADLQQSFAMAARAGCDGLALTCATPEDVKLLLADDSAETICQLAAEHGLSVPAIGLDILTGGESLFGDDNTIDLTFRLIRRATAVAKAAGAGIVVLPFQRKAAIETDSHFQRVLESLTDLAEEAEEAKVTLGVLSNLTISQQIILADDLKAYGSVKLYFDTACMLGRKLDPANCLRELGVERICGIRLRDYLGARSGEPPRWEVMPGEGDLDFRAVCQAMEAIGFDGWAVLDTPRTDADAAKAGVKLVRNLMP